MIDFDLNLIKIFVEVFESKSISIAASKLYISQPAVTKSIKKLENYLGTKLFIRKHNGILPTLEGHDFYAHSKEAINNVQQGINNLISFANLEKGHLRIGSSSTIIRILLTDFITKFSKQYPKIKITIVDGISGTLIKALKAKEIDLALLSNPIHNADGFEKTVITKTQDCFIAPIDFKQDFLTREELAKQPLVVQKYPSNNRESFDRVCERNNIRLTPNYEMTSFGLITDFVEKGLGIGFIIEDFIKKDLALKRVKVIKTDLNLLPRDVVALSNKTSSGVVCKHFISELKKQFN